MRRPCNRPYYRISSHSCYTHIYKSQLLIGRIVETTATWPDSEGKSQENVRRCTTRQRSQRWSHKTDSRLGRCNYVGELT